MHKIYFNDRFIAFCSKGEVPGGTVPGPKVLLDTGEKADGIRTAFISGSGQCPEYIVCQDPESSYRLFCSGFKEVNAAGGIVMDNDGRALLIKRNGVWDLPKGHQEEGEDILTTALREVSEETGAAGLVSGGLICVTDHCYFRDGTCHLKHTWWYRMSCGMAFSPVPQTEEGISEAVWLPASEFPSIMEHTYPSIKDVFSACFGNE